VLPELESISRDRPDRALRLQGEMGNGEALEVVIFRGFSSSLTHPTAFDPDQPLLPSEAKIESAVLLQAPLNPAAEQVLAGPRPAQDFLDPGLWG
tara:strand:+ start:13637 stop:13921 length:285 start_codon:yes stop_codon:yes gene_type:complete